MAILRRHELGMGIRNESRGFYRGRNSCRGSSERYWHSARSVVQMDRTDGLMVGWSLMEISELQGPRSRESGNRFI